MSNGILPALKIIKMFTAEYSDDSDDPTDLFVVSVVGEPLHDEVVDAVKCSLLVRGVLDCHGDEGDVGVGGLHHVLGGRVLGHPVVGAVW